MNTVIKKIEFVKSNVMSDPSVQSAWANLHTKISNQKISVDESTMASRDMVKELTLMNLNAHPAQHITDGTVLHYQKMSNLCVYFATMSAVRHEMKKIFENSTSTAINMPADGSPPDRELIAISAGKSIDELFKKEEIHFVDAFRKIQKFQNALSFETMLSVLLGCVSPRPLSALVKSINIKIILQIIFQRLIDYIQIFSLSY